MASEPIVAAPLVKSQTRRFSVLMLLRLEGLVAAVGTAALYAHTGASWWLFAALWLLPDLSMLGYLAGPCWGARCYNAIHTYVLPGTLGFSALLLHRLLPPLLSDRR